MRVWWVRRQEEVDGGELGTSLGGVLGYMLKSAFTMEGFTMEIKIHVIQCPTTESFKKREWDLT